MTNPLLSQVLFNEINLKIKLLIGVFAMSRAIENNDLRLKKVGDFEAQTLF